MEDLYKDDPNSWLRRAYFSNTVYRRPDPSQMHIISLAELKLASSKPNQNQAVTDTMSTMKLNPDNSFTGEVQGDSDFKANRTEPESKNSAISDILKNVKKTVERWFLAPFEKRVGTKTVKSSSRPKKESRKLQKYFDCGARQVGALEKCNEVH